MNTNQLMSISFRHGVLHVFHKSQMGNLTDIFSMGNKYRVLDDLPIIILAKFMKKPATLEFISELSNQLNIQKNEIVHVKGRGRNAKTFANLQFIIYCAMELSIKFKIEVINKFIEEQILTRRDDGGNDFKELNHYLNNLTDRIGKNNQGIFIQIAIKLKSKIFTENQIVECQINKVNIWNSSYATTVHLELRDKYEAQLISFIKMDFINSYNGVKEVIEKL